MRHRLIDCMIHRLVNEILICVVDAAPLTAAAILADMVHVTTIAADVIRALERPRIVARGVILHLVGGAIRRKGISRSHVVCMT